MVRFKAAVLQQTTAERPFNASQPLQIQEVTADPPRPGEVLIRIEAASLCRSDLSVIMGTRAWPLPIVPGHEASGIVEEVGSTGSSFAKGDRVVLVYQPQCGHCPCCISGEVHLCAPGLAANRAGKLLTGGPRLSLNGEALHHHMGLSAFAEMALVSENSLVKADRELPADIASLFGCAVICGAGSIINTGGVRPAETVAIVGIGGVGASAILGAVLAGAQRIVAVDPDPRKRKLALELGATEVVEAGDDAAAEIAELTQGGVDCALESAGVLGAFEIAYSSARRGGRVVTTGLVNPNTPFLLDVAALVTSAKTIHGSYMGSCNPQSDIPKLMELYKQGRFPVEKLITRRLDLADVNIALDNMADSKDLRQILRP